jgi:hypothetical protein
MRQVVNERVLLERRVLRLECDGHGVKAPCRRLRLTHWAAHSNASIRGRFCRRGECRRILPDGILDAQGPMPASVRTWSDVRS